ncbi:MAG: ROK family protein [Candidatus Omnitrophota bacterium]
MANHNIIGIDVGGTNVKLGLVDENGKIFARSRFKTSSYLSHPRQLIQAMAGGVFSLCQEQNLDLSQVRGIGIGLPGLVDPVHGNVIFLPNIPKWKNIPLKKELQLKLKIPVFLDNDVNVITLGEWKFGAGQGCTDIVGMTLGTGVGAGLILNGALYRGPGFAAGELGHIPINLKGPKCNCPSFACLEAYVGNKRLEQQAQKIFKKSQISLEEVSALAKQGDHEALRFWEETGEYIASALVGVVNLLNPQKIVIGGGVSKSSKFLFPVIRRQIRERAMPVQAKMARIVLAKLRDDAGLIGARVLVETELVNFETSGERRKGVGEK